MNVWRFCSEVFFAGLGTMAFSLLFHVPARYYPRCGLTGAAGWLVFIALKGPLGTLAATFFATLAVVLISRFSSVQLRCPVTIFLISGIFPLVPGLGIYQTAYALVEGDLAGAGFTGFDTAKLAAAMVLAILVGFEAPAAWFAGLARPFAQAKNER